MRRFLIVLILTFSAVFPALAEQRFALVMAVDGYKNVRPLGNAVNDAQTIKKSLEKLGFQVTLETDRDLRRMRRALEDFRQDAAGADVALVYFAGHGVEIAGENRLLPTDADATSADTLKQTSLPLEEVRETVASVSKVGLILLDACRNDPFAGGGGAGRGVKALTVKDAKEVRPGLGRLGKAENLLYTFSAAPGATAADGSGENSPFTAGLAKYLDTDGLEIRSVLTLVQQEVYDLSRGAQLPYVENGLPQMFFASKTASQLPERERLLLAMADVTPDLRDEVERLARDKDMPLAPLYGALIDSGAKSLSADDRRKKLAEAADAFVAVRAQMKTLASADPAVATLRGEAQRQLDLGAFETARGKLTEAATIDATSRDALKANFVDRTLSEATTHVISGGAARSNLKYELAIESYEKASALYDDLARDTLPEAQRKQQLESLAVLGDLYLTVGNLSGGRGAYERQQTLATALAAAEPSNTAWQDNIAASTLKLGDVLRDQGDSTAALASYERGLALRKELATGDAPAGALGLEADAFLKVGALHKLQGNDEMAMAAYVSARDIAARLVGNTPSDDELQSTLALSDRRIGEIQQDRKQLPQALASLQESLDISKKLADAMPDNALRQFDLATAYDALGYVQYDKNQADGGGTPAGESAVASFESSVAITRRLIAADPRNTSWQRGLAGTLERMGQAIYFGDGVITHEDADRSLAAYKEANGIRERLVQSDAANKLWVADLVTSYEKMATWYEFVPDDVTALEFTKKAHQAALNLAALDPQNMGWQHNATLYHAKIAGSYAQMKDYANALKYDEAGLAYAAKVVAAQPDRQPYQSDLIIFHSRVAIDKRQMNDYKGYWAQNDLRLEAAKKFAGQFPQDVNSLRDLYEAYVEVADSYTQNFPQDAMKLYKAAETAAATAASIEPKAPEFDFAVYNARVKTGYVLEDQGDKAGAAAAYEAALKSIRKAIDLKPDEVLYTASRDHALARIDGVRN
ncbi:caspase family protein [Mesorhizobium sp. B2-3-4]|uniref:caspase family protein n=1 Tax=Mesorhizobium sp. B2-3-4 TaxID=2589959 RepID=UPI00112A2FC5|nr:caspase family protein [Mesorhizobium sp. B2-3-4]TPM38620.1 peptidase C14 [Mesorhizobium sp. B2-3-4]